jgi:ATP:corrinoid adenosyltransferase
MIVVTALTGVTATLINSETSEHIDEWQKAHLLIIDEISFTSLDILIKLNTKLQALKEKNRSKYRKIHIIFMHDFSQLEPVTGYPLYYEINFAMWHDRVNCFIELTGQHQFKTDPAFGAIMKQVNGGCPTVGNIATLNSRVLNGNHHDAPTTQDLPSDMSFAVYQNADKSAINNSIFAEHIKKPT